MLESYRLRLKVRCPGCSAVLGVQRLSGKIRCGKCDTAIPIREIWKRADVETLEAEPRQLHSAAAANRAEWWLEYECRAPRCDRCRDAPLDVDELATMAASKRRPQCPACKQQVRLREADGIARDIHPHAKLIVAEGPDEAAAKPSGEEDLFVVCEVERRAKKRVVPLAEQKERLEAAARKREEARVEEAVRADGSPALRRASDKAISKADAEALADHEDWTVRLALAHNKSTPLHVLDLLAHGKDATVRSAVASHPELPAILLEELAADVWPDVRKSVAKHSKTPRHVLERLANDSVEAVRVCVEQRGIRSNEATITPPLEPAAVEIPAPAVVAPLVTLVGTVVQDDLAPRFIRARLAIASERGDDEVHRRERTQRFLLQLDDGAVVAIEPADAVAIREPEPGHLRWSEVADTAVGQLFADVAPGDHVEVAFASFTIAAGTRVAIRGRELAKPDDASAAYRAERLAIVERGDDAGAIASFDPPPPRPKSAPVPRVPARPARPPSQPRPWRIVAPILLGIGLCLFAGGALVWRPLYQAVMFDSFTLALLMLEAGIGFAMMALGMWMSREPFETIESKPPARSRADTERADGSINPPWNRGKGAVLIGIVALVAICCIDGCAGAENSMTWAGVAPLLLVVTGASFVWLLRPAKQLRLARLLLHAPRLPSTTAEGTTGTFEGVVEDIGVAVGRRVEYNRYSSTRTEQVRNQDGSYSTREVTSSWLSGEAHERSFQRFTVRGERDTIEIIGGRATWGAPLEYTRPGGSRPEIVTRSKIEAGDSILVRGKLALEHGKPVMSATGRESVVMFGADRDARATLAIAVASWQRLAYAMLALVALSAAASILLWTEEPPAAQAPPTWPPVAPHVLPGERL